MSLPPRAFYTLFEAAVRWECDVADIAEWALAEHLRILVLIPPCSFAGRMFSDLVEVAPSDVYPMLRRYDRRSRELRITRVRYPGESEWAMIKDAEEGLRIGQIDLQLSGETVTAFEERHIATRRGGAGPTTKYDWDGFYAAMTRRIHEEGIPHNQAELIGVMQDWFVANSRHGDAPDESTIRKKVSRIWRELRGAA